MEDCGLHKRTTIQLKRGRFGETYSAEVLALDLSGGLSPALASILNDSANAKALALANTLKSEPGHSFGAVYMIGPEDSGLDVVKVGIADDPRKRLCELQVGNWNKLEVKGLLWFDSGPGGVERLVHKAAAEMGIGLRGEWLATSIGEAAMLVLKAARYSGRVCYDSDIWLKNWANRLEALVDAKGIKGRLAA